jgi:hypothetical protein
MTPLIASATKGKLVRLLLKDGTLHYEYRRGAHRPDPEIVLCGEGPGKRVFLRKKGLEYVEVDWVEAPLPL